MSGSFRRALCIGAEDAHACSVDLCLEVNDIVQTLAGELFETMQDAPAADSGEWSPSSCGCHCRSVISGFIARLRVRDRFFARDARDQPGTSELPQH